MKTEKETVKLIIKKEKYGLIAFYVDDHVNRGNIASMTFFDGHTEASVEYYFHCKKPTNKEASQFISRYEKHYDCKVERRFRLTYDDYLKMWGMK